jgi:hypothetical protein
MRGNLTLMLKVLPLGIRLSRRRFTGTGEGDLGLMLQHGHPNLLACYAWDYPASHSGPETFPVMTRPSRSLACLPAFLPLNWRTVLAVSP